MIRPELREEMLHILEDVAGAPVPTMFPWDTFDPRWHAVGLLLGHGALTEVTARAYAITLGGYAYYEELKTPRRYWLKQNWFPVAVLVVSSLVTVATSLIVGFLA